MTQDTDADVAMQGCRRVQAALLAMAEEDAVGVLRQVNEASPVEARWMVSQLLSQVNGMAVLLAAQSKRGSTRARVLRAAADGMENDVATTGAAVVVSTAMRREGLI